MPDTAKKPPKAPAPTAWDIVQLARDPGRPTARQYAEGMCDEFLEMHGDRLCADDPAILGGLGRIGKQRFVLVGHQKDPHSCFSPSLSGGIFRR